MTVRRTVYVLTALVIATGGAAATAVAHDLFLRPRDFVVRSGDSVQVRVLNGTFTSSEAVVDAERLRDLVVAGPGTMRHLERTGWASSGTESTWRVGLGAPGTWLLGASLAPRTILLTGRQFSEYLRADGLPDMLAARRRAGIAGEPAHERYGKHVKSLVRVTGAGTADTSYRIVLGYPAEIIPLADPYALAAGAPLRVLAMVDGKAAAGQVILSGGRRPNGKRFPQRQVRTDASGHATIRLAGRGTHYLKFIHMVAIPHAANDSVTHESKWASLTFATP